MRIVLYRPSIVVVLFVFLLQTLIPVQMAFAQNAAATRSTFTVFSNSTPITLNTASGLTAPTTASNYPSTINVSGMTGNTTKVEVSIKGVSHTMNQIDMLLCQPDGREVRISYRTAHRPAGTIVFIRFRIGHIGAE